MMWRLLLAISLACPALSWAEEAAPDSRAASEAEAATVPQAPSLPWLATLRAGMGVDDNIDLSRYGSKATALGGFELSGLARPRQDLHLALQAGYYKNLPFSTAGDGELAFFVGHLHELPAKFQLRLSAELAYRQERSVFADGAILQNTTAVQDIAENSVAVLLSHDVGAFDLEFGGQGNFEDHNGGAEDSRLIGGHAIAGLRYTHADRVALRARYTYERSDTRGLSPRNLAGGIEGMRRPLLIGLSRFRLSARTRIGQKSSVFVRYDYVSAIDDFSGFLDSHEHVLFATSTFEFDAWTLESTAEYAHRNFYKRTPSIENPDTDTTFASVIRADAWVLPPLVSAQRLGLFAQYRADVVRADPTGLVFARHIVLGGLSAQFGNAR